MLDSKSQMLIENKLLLHKAILKAICVLRPPIQHIERLQRFQNKYLRIIVNAPWYITLRHDLNVPYVRDEIKRLRQRYADRKTYSRLIS